MQNHCIGESKKTGMKANSNGEFGLPVPIAGLLPLYQFFAQFQSDWRSSFPPVKSTISRGCFPSFLGSREKPLGNRLVAEFQPPPPLTKAIGERSVTEIPANYQHASARFQMHHVIRLQVFPYPVKSDLRVHTQHNPTDKHESNEGVNHFRE